MSFCCCSLAGTSACRYCRNNPNAVVVTDKILVSGTGTQPNATQHTQCVERIGDMVEVVRCKDCRFSERYTEKLCYCKINGAAFNRDGFCSKGDPKDGAK